MPKGIVFSSIVPVGEKYLEKTRSLRVGDIIIFHRRGKTMSLCDKHGTRGYFYSGGDWNDKLTTPGLDCGQEPFDLAMLIAAIHGLVVSIVSVSETVFSFELK